MAALEAGALDVESGDGGYTVLTEVADFAAVQDALRAKGIEWAEAELAMVQETTVTVEEFTEFLLSGTSMSDRQIIDCFVWSIVLDNDDAVVTLNWDHQQTQKNEPARIELVRKDSEWLPEQGSNLQQLG